MIVKLKKVVDLLVVLLCLLLVFAYCTFTRINSYAYCESNIYSETDKEILNFYRKPSLEDAFEDNVINVILKSGFSGEIGFDDFNLNNILSKISTIT